MRPPGIEIGPRFSADEYNPYKRKSTSYASGIQSTSHHQDNIYECLRLGKCALEASERQHAAVDNKDV